MKYKVVLKFNISFKGFWTILASELFYIMNFIYMAIKTVFLHKSNITNIAIKLSDIRDLYLNHTLLFLIIKNYYILIIIFFYQFFYYL